MTAEQRKVERKKPKVKYPEMPMPKSAFFAFFTNLMLIKTLLFKYGYSDHWQSWDFEDCIESGYVLLLQGYEI